MQNGGIQNAGRGTGHRLAGVTRNMKRTGAIEEHEMTTATELRTTKGGAWLLEDTAPGGMFTPERLSDEHRMMFRTALGFTTNEVMPHLDRLESKDWTLSRELVRRCGALGLLATDTPEEYGGLALDKVSSLVVAEGMAPSASFAGTFGAMTGLAIMPLVM